MSCALDVNSHVKQFAGSRERVEEVSAWHLVHKVDRELHPNVILLQLLTHLGYVCNRSM
jgi:hypothetical protein